MRIVEYDPLKEFIQDMIKRHSGFSDDKRKGFVDALQTVDYELERYTQVYNVDLCELGKWIRINPTESKYHMFCCSSCDQIVDEMTPYCPNCGARMRSKLQ